MLYMFYASCLSPSSPSCKTRLGSESGSGSTLNGKSISDRHQRSKRCQPTAMTLKILGLHSMLYMFSASTLSPSSPSCLNDLNSDLDLHKMENRVRIRIGIKTMPMHSIALILMALGFLDCILHCIWIFGLHSMFYMFFASCLNSSCSSSINSCCRNSCAFTSDSISSSLCACAPLLPRDTTALNTARFSSSAS